MYDDGLPTEKIDKAEASKLYRGLALLQARPPKASNAMKTLKKAWKTLAEINIFSWLGIGLGLSSLWHLFMNHPVKPDQVMQVSAILMQTAFVGGVAVLWEFIKKRRDRVAKQLLASGMILIIGVIEFQRTEKMVVASTKKQALEFVAGKFPEETLFESEAIKKNYLIARQQRTILDWRSGHPLKGFYGYQVKSLNGEILYKFSITYKTGESKPYFSVYK